MPRRWRPSKPLIQSLEEQLSAVSSVKAETVASTRRRKTSSKQQQEAKENPPFVRVHTEAKEFELDCIISVAERKCWTKAKSLAALTKLSPEIYGQLDAKSNLNGEQWAWVCVLDLCPLHVSEVFRSWVKRVMGWAVLCSVCQARPLARNPSCACFLSKCTSGPAAHFAQMFVSGDVLEEDLALPWLKTLTVDWVKAPWMRSGGVTTFGTSLGAIHESEEWQAVKSSGPPENPAVHTTGRRRRGARRGGFRRPSKEPSVVPSAEPPQEPSVAAQRPLREPPYRGVACVLAFRGTPARLRPSEREGLRSDIDLQGVRPSSTRDFVLSSTNKSDTISCIRRIITTSFCCGTGEPR